jgi:hypothetical protein
VRGLLGPGSAPAAATVTTVTAGAAAGLAASALLSWHQTFLFFS